MFKKIGDVEHLGYNEKTNQYNWRIQIIDTDFEDVVVADRFQIEFNIIDCYTRRNLPVAPNLIRYMLNYRDQYGVSLDWQVEYNKQFNPRWHEVEKDFQLYMVLS